MPGRQQKMLKHLAAENNLKKTVELKAPGFGLAQPMPLQLFGECTDRWKLFVCPSVIFLIIN